MIELPDDLQPLHEITERDWQLIEHLAWLADRRSGNVLMAGAIEAERARQMLELSSAAILNIIQHLAVFRRSDLIEALEIADDLYNLTGAILKRSAAEMLRIKPNAPWAAEALAEQWERAQRQPKTTMSWLRLQGAKLEGASKEKQARIRAAMATRLGLDPRQPLVTLRPLVHGRQDVLLRLADPLHREATAWRGDRGDAGEIEQMLAAYSQVALLQDARTAGGWAALADGLGVTVGSVIAAYRLLAAAGAPEQPEPEPEPARVEQPEPERTRGCTAADDTVLQWITAYIRDNGTSPTGPQIAAGLGVSEQQAAYRLRTLQVAGRLDWQRVGHSRVFRLPAAA